MWFKKKAYISGYNSNTAVDGSDWRTTGMARSWATSQTLPSAADAGNYFYLPALGCYYSGQLRDVGSYGYYWSSSAYPGGSDSAYTLSFGLGFVYMNYTYRRYGFRAEVPQ